MDNFAAPTTFVVARGPPDVSPVGDCVECFRVPSRKMVIFVSWEGLSDTRSILIAARACGAGPTEPRVGFSATYFYYTILLYANTKSLSKLYFVTGNEAKTKGA